MALIQTSTLSAALRRCYLRVECGLCGVEMAPMCSRLRPSLQPNLLPMNRFRCSVSFLLAVC